MKSAYFVHSHISLSLIKALTSKGYDLITTSPEFEMFCHSHTKVILWSDIEKREAKVLNTLFQYEEIIVSAEADLVELLFVHPRVLHILEWTNRYDKKGLLSQLYQRSLAMVQSQSAYYHSDAFLQHAKVCYLMQKFDECEKTAYRLLIIPNQKKGEEALSLLVANETAQNHVEKAIQLLNALAYNSHFKRILDIVLIEKDESQRKKWLFRAGNDYVSGEVIAWSPFEKKVGTN
jgi:hypothetical protein